MNDLIDLVYAPRSEWDALARGAFSRTITERFSRVTSVEERSNSERKLQLRVNAKSDVDAVPFAALLPPEQELSGPYGGMSFVLFPSDDEGEPALLAMVVGTNGLAPDESILGRPGHARKCAAIAAWLNSRLPGSAWAKRDPVRIDIDLPRSMDTALEAWRGACSKYGKVIYALFRPPQRREGDAQDILRDALEAYLDLFFDERRIDVKKDFRRRSESIRRDWMRRLMPTATIRDVATLLHRKRFVILEGPPGTGKTECAMRLLHDHYGGRGRIIQFHPGSTYESFIGGLSPLDGGALGFTFRPSPGHLMQACMEARKSPNGPYLLIIDEINRADLSKVLGEAIHLFEPNSPDRSIMLSYEYPDMGRHLALPTNLHVVGTMNSADRSIAILDIAVRRRFAFVKMWPQLEVVEKLSSPFLYSSFQELINIFVEHASEDALALTPGHAYFLGSEDSATSQLITGVRPLLMEYLSQGYVAGFADEIRAYLDRTIQAS